MPNETQDVFIGGRRCPSGIKPTWPAAGPKVIWKRPLGEGYSSPSVEGGALYTMYGRPGQEIVTALEAGTGKTLWEQAAPMTFRSDAAGDMGNGPYATPLLAGDRLFTAGVSGRLQCLDKKTGKVLWTEMLWMGHGGTRLMYGYASSPIAFRDTVIVPVGAKLLAVVDPGGWARTSGAGDGRPRVRTESAQRRSAMASSLQGRLRDQRRYTGMVSGHCGRSGAYKRPRSYGRMESSSRWTRMGLSCWRIRLRRDFR
ncbi:MAG: PQQ-binding-like beta-propeller repeat protein [Acidobacteriia bacterium]|nr:PQQ-binding-like beta-propeller repeat protein [Terriglobia bacterium]